MKKKFLYGVCIIMLMLSLTACGKGDKKVENKELFPDREKLSTKLADVYYTEDWKYDTETLSDEDGYVCVDMYIGTNLDSAEATVKIIAEAEEVSSFRKDLISGGIALEEYADGAALTTSIGNTKFASLKSDYGTSYIYRHPESGTTYNVTVDGDAESQPVKDLLEGIILTLKDTGNVDAPWPWDGTAFSHETTEQVVGKYKVKAELVKFEEPKVVYDIMCHKFAKVKDKLYWLQDDILTTYDYTDAGLVYNTELQLEDDYEYISADKTGMLYLSQGVFNVIGIKDNYVSLTSEITGDLVMHNSGKWGISFWVGSDTQEVSKKNNTLTSKPWILTGLDDDSKRKGIFNMLQEVAITDDKILVAGSTAGDDSSTKIVVYNQKGKELYKLGGEDFAAPDSLGSITGMVETKNGFVAADGNMRKIQFWNKKGKHIGTIDAEDIFGTSYPWIEDMQLLEDGSILIALTQEREDNSADELLFFRLTGF